MIAKQPVARFTPLVNDEVPDPCMERMPEVSMLPVVVVDLPTPRPFETVSWLVDACPVTARYEVVADVEVERMEERNAIEELAFTTTPTVEVGVIAFPCAVNCQSFVTPPDPSVPQANLPVEEL